MAWRLCRKDLVIFLRDRLGLMLGLGLPVVLALVFGAAMGSMGGDSGLSRVRFVVEDQDGSEASRALVSELLAAEGLRVTVIEVPAPDSGVEQEIDASFAVSTGEAPGGLVIQEGFGDELAAGRLRGLVLVRDLGRSIEQQVIAGSLMRVLLVGLGENLGQSVVDRLLDMLEFPEEGRERAKAILGVSWVAMDQLLAGLKEEGASFGAAATDAASDMDDAQSGADDLTAGGGFDLSQIVVNVFGLVTMDAVGGGMEAAAARQVANQAHAVSGIAVMMLLFGLVSCGGTLLQEEAEGTLERLRLAPCGIGQILAGKFLFTWLVGVTQLLILFLVTSAIFSIPVFREPLALAVLSGSLAVAATGFGVLFAALCRTRAQLEGTSTVVILTMSALGGSWWPLIMTPEWYQKLAHFTLNAWAMDGYQALFWFEKGLVDILAPIGVLLGIGAVTSLLAMRLWRRRLRLA